MSVTQTERVKIIVRGARGIPAVGSLGFTPANIAGDVFQGPVYAPHLAAGQTGVLEPAFAYTEDLSQVSITSEDGNYALTLYSRTSDNPNAGSMSTTGIGSFVRNDNTTQLSTAYCGYFEFERFGGAATTQGIEVQAVNHGSVGQYSPWGFDIGQVTLPFFTSACRPDKASTSHNVSCAFGIHNNSGGGAPYFERGIVFAHDAVEPVKSEVFTCSQQHNLAWYNQRGWRNVLNGDGGDLRYEGNTTSSAILYRFSRASSTGGACPTDCRLFEFQGYSVDTGGSSSTLQAVIMANLRGSASSGHGSLELIQRNGSGVQKGVSMGLIDQSFTPLSDNDINLGGSSLRWQNVYAGNGTINTSDARLKNDLGAPAAAILAAIDDVAIKNYQFLDMIALKGADHARIHSGIIAQELIAAFEARGLDWRRYGVVGEDPDMEEVAVEEETEEPVTETVDVETLVNEMAEDGSHMIQRKIVEQAQRPVLRRLPVLDEEGNPVMIPAVPEQRMFNRATGKIVRISAQPERPYEHEVPVTQKVTKVVGTVMQQKTVDGVPQTRFSIRYDQLSMLMIAALRSRLAALEVA